jgi:FtsZ-binding cell division protein ZapB
MDVKNKNSTMALIEVIDNLFGIVQKNVDNINLLAKKVKELQDREKKEELPILKDF